VQRWRKSAPPASGGAPTAAAPPIAAGHENRVRGARAPADNAYRHEIFADGPWPPHQRMPRARAAGGAAPVGDATRACGTEAVAAALRLERLKPAARGTIRSPRAAAAVGC
jgi:hypothetical protein